MRRVRKPLSCGALVKAHPVSWEGSPCICPIFWMGEKSWLSISDGYLPASLLGLPAFPLTLFPCGMYGGLPWLWVPLCLRSLGQPGLGHQQRQRREGAEALAGFWTAKKPCMSAACSQGQQGEKAFAKLRFSRWQDRFAQYITLYLQTWQQKQKQSGKEGDLTVAHSEELHI